MARQDRLNWQIRFAGQEMAATQVAEFEALFGRDARACYDDPEWRTEWLAALTGITMVSDGYLPFTDNVDHAAESGVSVIVETGGSQRTSEIVDRANSYGITHVQTGVRLFHH